jgi:hypothetical protein
MLMSLQVRFAWREAVGGLAVLSHCLTCLLSCALSTPAALQTRPAIPPKRIPVWVQLYIDHCPLGPPIEVPIHVERPVHAALAATTDSSGRVRHRVSIGDIRYAVKAECGSVLSGVSMPMLQVYGSDWSEDAPTSVLSATDIWNSTVHGGTLESPMIVYALPKPRM